MMLATQRGFSVVGPSIRDFAIRTDIATQGGSHTITLPTFLAGDLLVAFVSAYRYTYGAPAVSLSATGWTVVQYPIANGTNYLGAGALIYKVASGGDSLVVTNTFSNTQLSSVCYAIKDASTLLHSYTDTLAYNNTVAVLFPALSASPGVWLRGWTTVTRWPNGSSRLTALPSGWGDAHTSSNSISDQPATTTFTKTDGSVGAVIDGFGSCGNTAHTEISWTVSIT